MSPLSHGHVGGAGKDATLQKDHSPGSGRVGTKAVGALSLRRKVAMCAGLMGSESMGVFSTLNTMPLLQALGSPVYLLTVPGVLSSLLGLTFVPLMGWINDRGSNPHKRKKPFTLVAFSVGLLGLILNLSSASLSSFLADKALNNITDGSLGFNDTASSSSGTIISINDTSSGINGTITSIGDSININGSVNGSIININDTTTSTSDTIIRINGTITSITGIINNINDTINAIRQVNGSVLSDSEQGLFADLDKLSSDSQKDSTNDPNSFGDSDAEDDSSFYTTVSNVIRGLPAPVYIAILGFMFMDFGFDLGNSAIKALILTYSAPEDHVSLLVVGVFMAALGGCATSVCGLVDLGSLMPDIDPVCSQAIIQLTALIILNVLCVACSVLSAPSLPSTETLLASGLPYADSLAEEEEEQQQQQQQDEREDVGSIPWQEASENVFFATLTPAEALMSQSTQIERSFRHLSVSASFSQSHHLRYLHLHVAPEPKKATPLLSSKAHSQRHYEAIPENPAKGSFLDNRKFKLMIVWLAEFFTACGIFIFSVVLADYVGKDIYKGNPLAHEGSEAYLLYQQGMRMASLCVLIVSVAYVTSALCQSKVLAAISPKTEYVLVSVAYMVLVVVVYLTASLPAVIVCSAFMGINRTAMYTVPFLLATQLCQQPPANSFSAEEGGRRRYNGSNFGSTMAFVTSALPSAYLVTCSFVGPLVDATGDPATPFVIAAGCLLMSALSISCYKE